MKRVLDKFYLEMFKRGFRERLEIATLNLIRKPTEPLKDTIAFESLKVWTLRYNREGGEYNLDLTRSGYYTDR